MRMIDDRHYSANDLSMTPLSYSNKAKAMQATGILYITATPIGNLADWSYRAVELAQQVDVIACEDTRTTRVLLQHYGITTRLVAYHEHSNAEETQKIMDYLAAGQQVMLVSDAGTPLISDPGYMLVRSVQDAGHKVVPIPGASSVIAALSASGLPTQHFMFIGFLPPKAQARMQVLTEYAELAATLVFFEAPHRLLESLQALCSLMPTRELCVAREVSKHYEDITRASVQQVLQYYQAKEVVKGECVLMLAPKPTQRLHDADIANGALDSEITTLLHSASVKEVAAELAQMYHAPKRAVYARALELRRLAITSKPE